VRVLVDTSVWSRALRAGGDPADPTVVRLAALVGKADVVLTGMVLQEVLQGFRGDAAFGKVARHLEAFPLLQLDRAHYVAAARLRRTCAAAGVAASTGDCQIAAAAMGHRCRLLTLDKDFEAMARHAPLRLLHIGRDPTPAG
jgi:predicted nucleic acid-binding protein